MLALRAPSLEMKVCSPRERYRRGQSLFLLLKKADEKAAMGKR